MAGCASLGACGTDGGDGPGDTPPADTAPRDTGTDAPSDTFVDTFVPDAPDTSVLDSGSDADVADVMPKPAVAPWVCKKAPIAPTPTDACGDDHWCWWSPSPTGSDLKAVHATGPSDVWAAGAGGVVMHWDGAKWSQRPTGDRYDVVALVKHPTDGVWAVDRRCNIRRWGGTSWVTVSGPCTDFHSAVDLWIGAADDAWRLEGLGDTAHWNGATWTTVSSPSSGALMTAVHGVSKSDVWAVGLDATVVHWNGTSWSKLSTPDPSGYPHLHAVWGAVSNQVWMGGDSKKVYRWNGTSFGSFDLPDAAAPIGAIWGTSANDVWFAEGNRYHGVTTQSNIFHWDGVSITKAATLPSRGFHDIHGDSPSSVWAVGDNGALAKWNGTEWKSLRSGFTFDVMSFWGSASNDVWAAARGTTPSGDEGAMFHFDGTSWSESVHFAHAVEGVWGIAPDDVWAAGVGGAEHWDGKSWSHVATPSSIRRMWGAAADDIWALGTYGSGELLHWDGTSWSLVPGALDGKQTMGITGTSTNDVWVVTGDSLPTLFHWNGVAWSVAHKSTVLVTEDPFDLFASGPKDVWMLGFTAITHWDGTTWTSHDVTGEGGTWPTHLWGFASDDIWAGGGSFNVHWDGTNMVEKRVGLGTEPSAIWGCTADDLWMGGPHGTFAHRSP